MRRTLIALSLAGTLAAAPSTLLDSFRTLFLSLWGDSGCMIDPNGRCAALRGDEGCMIDPDGRCATQRVDEGCRIDPNGGCRRAPRVDEGCHIDPDGRCGF
ncbi:MAG TPA: hypothetical protein VN493_22185 [Thermoanaerobaculia bacterium]|nr:hypothetical protein [Thermoanaerobaculia bacterium]